MVETGITRNRIRTFLATRKGPGLRVPASIPSTAKTVSGT